MAARSRSACVARAATSESGRAEDLSKFESIALFVERARAANPRFTLTDQPRPPSRRSSAGSTAFRWRSARAARVKVLGVEQTREARRPLPPPYGRQPHGAGAASNAAPPIAWSYDMLSTDEKHLLRGLSVFAGGWTLEAASKVCCLPDPAVPTRRPADPRRVEVLDLLTKLVDKSLVVVEEALERHEATRATDCRRSAVAHDEAQQRKSWPTAGASPRVLPRAAREAELKLDGADRGAWLRRMEKENENLAALEFAKPSRRGRDGDVLAGPLAVLEIRGELTVGYTR